MPIKNLIFKRFITPMDYHYNPADGMWYDVDTEQIPVPTTKAIALDTLDIKFFNGFYMFKDLNTDEDFIDYASEAFHGIIGGPGFSFIFTNQKQEEIGCYFESFLLWDFDEFIETVKQDKFAAIYVEPYTELKFMVWPLGNNRLRFIIQNQCNDEDFYVGPYDRIDFDKPAEYKFLDSLLDIEIDKKTFLTAMENAIKQTKNALRTLIATYLKNNNMSDDKFHFLASKMGLEPKE